VERLMPTENEDIRKFIEEEISWALHYKDEKYLEHLIDRHYTSVDTKDWLNDDERYAIAQAWQKVTGQTVNTEGAE
jgi:hypothetical protein